MSVPRSPKPPSLENTAGLEVEICCTDADIVKVGNLTSCSVREYTKVLKIVRIVKVRRKLAHERFDARIHKVAVVCDFGGGFPGSVELGALGH